MASADNYTSETNAKGCAAYDPPAMTHDLKEAIKALGYDPTPSPSESDPVIAKQRLFEAMVNCELIKARAEVNAKMIVKRLRKRPI